MMNAMKDVTSLLNTYRECSRHLWNTYLLNPSDLSGPPDDIERFTAVADAYDRFLEIDRPLFASVVLSKIERLDSEKAFRQKALRFLKVIPVSSSAIPIHINRPSPDGNKYWDDPVNKIQGGDAELLFCSYYDWNNYDFLDFRYCLTEIASFPKHTNLVGRQALIQTIHARILFDEAA